MSSTFGIQPSLSYKAMPQEWKLVLLGEWPLLRGIHYFHGFLAKKVL